MMADDIFVSEWLTKNGSQWTTVPFFYFKVESVTDISGKEEKYYVW